MTSSIWTEKYRPQTFEEVKGQKEIVKKLKAFVATKQMPHLMFAGPAGVGKTTLSLVIAKELFGPSWRSNTLELNASDERGIDVVRTKVKDFARTKALGNVPFKLIYLDESDALTKEAQQALRRTMENYTRTCRFILSCNYSSKILDPIQSRCAIFRFKPLPKDELMKVVNNIASKEQITISDKAKDALIEITGGDCRKLENIMQSCATLSKNIDEELIYSMASLAKPKELGEVMQLAVDQNFPMAKKKLLDLTLNYGLSGTDIIRQLSREIWNLNLADKQKVQLIDKCGDIEFRLTEGSDEYVQLTALLAYAMLVGSKQLK
ncbi:replication factor C small subunit [archaeon]|jgi:replication factor C small subunit|nr:replication factor C small subunit [archaeon]MBT6697644.1 replication factor C small subunit [archaeon]